MCGKAPTRCECWGKEIRNELYIWMRLAKMQSADIWRFVRTMDWLIKRRYLSVHSVKESAETVQYLVKKYLAQIDLGGPGYSVHKLRHTAATLMYQHGHVDIRVLKDIWATKFGNYRNLYASIRPADGTSGKCESTGPHKTSECRHESEGGFPKERSLQWIES